MTSRDVLYDPEVVPLIYFGGKLHGFVYLTTLRRATGT